MYYNNHNSFSQPLNGTILNTNGTVAGYTFGGYSVPPADFGKPWR